MKLRKIENWPLAGGNCQPGKVMKGLLFIFLAFFGIGCAHEPTGELFAENTFQDEQTDGTISRGGLSQAAEKSSDIIPGSPPLRAQRAGKLSFENSFATAQASEGDLEDDDLDIWDKPDKEDSEDDLDIWDDQETPEEEAISVADPLEPWNRIMFHFNDKLYYWVLKPVASGYKTVTPMTVRIGVKNFFRNLTTPIRMANCVLQGKFHSAEVEFARFLSNSTVGILGFADVAGKNPRFVRPPGEDLGQTLAVYGIGNGIYLIWPILGPSTMRDFAGTVGDRFLNPITWVDIPIGASMGATAFKTVNETSFRLGNYESFKEAAIEPYESFRDAYLQYRRRKAENTEDDEDDRRYDILIKEWIK